MMKAAYLTLTHSTLVSVAEPYIQRVAAITTETVDLSVPTDLGAIIVNTVYTPRPFRPYNPPGMTMAGLSNVHCKLFTAFGPKELWHKAIAGNVPLTPRSLTDAGALAAQLAEIRRQGVAFGIEEHKLGMCAVGAPVFDSTGTVRAALAVVVPVERFGQVERDSFAEALIEAAAALSRRTRLQEQPGYPLGRDRRSHLHRQVEARVAGRLQHPAADRQCLVRDRVAVSKGGSRIDVAEFEARRYVKTAREAGRG